MRLIVFANNWVGWKVLEYLVTAGEDIAGVVVHTARDRKFGDEILAAVPGSARVIEAGKKVGSERVRREIEELAPERGVSAFYGYILPDELIRAFPKEIVNIHPSMLPHSRGIYANVWSILERAPAGATLHYIDAGVDSGDIIAQKSVPVEPVDTGQTLYEKLTTACVELFTDSWPMVRAGTAPRHPQDHARATIHKRDDVSIHDRIDLDREYKARDLIDLLRARTFRPYRGAYFETEDGRRVYLSLDLEYGP